MAGAREVIIPTYSGKQGSLSDTFISASEIIIDSECLQM